LLEPPLPQAVRQSVEELIGIGALVLDADRGCEELTTLGARLVGLPVDARVGKLVLLSVPFGRAVVDAAVTVAAVLAVGTPFNSAFERRFQIRRAQYTFAEKLAVGGLSCSDLLGALQAYREWARLSYKERPGFCREQSLRLVVLREMSETRDQLLDSMVAAGLIPACWRRASTSGSQRHSGFSRGKAVLVSNAEARADAGSVITDDCAAAITAALLCASLFPRVAFVRRKDSLLSEMGQEARVAPVELLVHEDRQPSKFTTVQVHPSSVGSREKLFGSPFVLYHELVCTGRVYVRDVTPVPPLTLALFAGALAPGVVKFVPVSRRSNKGVLEIGSWIKLAIPVHIRAQVLEIRARLKSLWRASLKLDRVSLATNDNVTERSRGFAMVEPLTRLLTLPVVER